eukprot:SAG11_NODE_2817_length_2943_cov_4.626934_3_plen_78_part_00
MTATDVVATWTLEYRPSPNDKLTGPWILEQNMGTLATTSQKSRIPRFRFFFYQNAYDALQDDKAQKGPFSVDFSLKG